jgi:hypothetical protein
MKKMLTAALLVGCLFESACIPVRDHIEFWDVSGDGKRGDPPSVYIGEAGCTYDHRPRFIRVELAAGATAYFGYGYGLQGYITLPPGVSARFKDGIAEARTDAGRNVQGTVKDLHLYRSEKMSLPPTTTFGNQYDSPSPGVPFEFHIAFDEEMSDSFSFIPPALEINGHPVALSAIRFTKRREVEWTLQPCV